MNIVTTDKIVLKIGGIEVGPIGNVRINGDSVEVSYVTPERMYYKGLCQKHNRHNTTCKNGWVRCRRCDRTFFNWTLEMKLDQRLTL